MNRRDLPAPDAVCETCGKPYRRCARCLKMRSSGIDSWRYHCDSAECYQVLMMTQRDPATITKDEYDFLKAIELPEERKPIKEIQDKLDAIDAWFTERVEKPVIKSERISDNKKEHKIRFAQRNVK